MNLKEPQANSSQKKLKSKLNYYLNLESSPRKEITIFLNTIQENNTCAFFGGFLRDITLSRLNYFQSDLDIVYTGSKDEMSQVLTNYKSTKNKFGGDRIHLEKIYIDIWHLNDTLFLKHLNNPSLKDLSESSFFNWDAIAYEIQSEKVIAPKNYFHNIKNNILEIQNPAFININSPFKKLHRYFKKHEPTLGINLCLFIVNNFHLLKKDEIGTNIYNDLHKIYSYILNQKELPLLPVDLSRNVSMSFNWNPVNEAR